MQFSYLGCVKPPIRSPYNVLFEVCLRCVWGVFEVGVFDHRDARGPPSIGRPQIHCSQKFTQNRLNTEIYSTGPRGVLYGHLNRTRKPTINKKIIEEIYFAILRADRCPAEWVLRSRKKTRGALERVFTNFFAQTGKKHIIIENKEKHSNHTRWPKMTILSIFGTKKHQNHLSRASAGPR